MRLIVREVGEQDLDRVAQLCQRTNQFNLTTKRHTRDDLTAFARSCNNTLLLLKLSDKAREEYAGFVDRLGKRADESAEPDVRAVLGKVEGVAARLALVCQLAGDPAKAAVMTEVGVEAMRAGIGLAEWFACETVRAYGLIEETAGELPWRSVR